ncbi:MAG: class I SAM-dependent methyltransferase [Magnetococcales bacterium]|nr:class I SAM-dependent methyltransferase [Magnetococcales bacterium]
MQQPRGIGDFPDWETLYKNEPVESMPWYTTHLDQDLEQALRDLHISSGAFLDLGTGPGTQAAALAGLGFQVTATDLSTSAIAAAAKWARTRGVCITLLQDDILASQLIGPFDFAFDRGCFHVLPPESRAHYVETLHALLAPEGRLFLKCFSVKETSNRPPYRFSPDLIAEIFSARFHIETCRESLFDDNGPEKRRALFNILKCR